jgi:acetolactate synthase-1/2/3 large subunit
MIDQTADPSTPTPADEATEPAPEVPVPAAEPAEESPQPAADEAFRPVVDAAEVAPPEPGTTVGRWIADALHAAGVRWAFTVPGESFLGLLDVLDDAGIRVVATRHEGAAAFMAEAVGQLTGRPALCLGTRAVGATNLAIGIHTARADSSPMIVAIGQVERAMIGREAFQEIDLVATIGALAKWAAEPRSAADVPADVGEAIRQAVSGRPGPALLSLPEDLLDEPLTAPRGGPVTPATAGRPDPGVVHAILQMLASARRPVILAGAGVLRARCSTDLLRLADLLRVPVIATWRRADVVSNDHPLYLGMVGYGAPRTVVERLDSADAVLVIGSRLGEITTAGYRVPHPGQRWAHVDLEPRGVVADLPRPDLALVADGRAFLRAALERLRGAVIDAASADERSAANAADRAAWEAATTIDGGDWDGPGVHPGRVVATLRRVLPDDAIVTTDAGNMAGWLARGYRARRPGTFLGPTSGAMGYGLPAAIAAALVHRDRPVVAWAGDGGFAMTMAELETAVRERLRIVAVVLDNERYGTIRMHQEWRGVDAPIATDLGTVDFAAVARGLGANGVRLDSDAGFESALRSAIAGDRPTVIQLALDRRWISVDDRPVS